MEETRKEASRETVQALCAERRQDGQVWICNDGAWVAVRACTCFPWTEPTRYVSLRDEDDREIVLIRDLDDLEADSRAVIEDALKEVRFVLQVERIESIDEEFEIRNWKVRTRQGPRTFQTEHDAWPRPLSDGGLLIKDVAGDLFYVANLDKLDDDSKKLLWPFLD